MRLAEIIGSNIQELMDKHSVTAVEIAKLIGVTRPTLSNYLNGESVIDSEKLYTLAEYFNEPFEYFMRDKKADNIFMFRAANPKENFDEVTFDKINTYVDLFYKLSQNDDESKVFIPEQYKLTIKYNSKIVSVEDPKLNIKELPNDLENTLELIAYEQRKKLGLEESVGTEILRALEEAGLKIIFKPLYNLDLFGISAFNKEKGFFIIINDDEGISEERKLFSLIHEYAHILLHRDSYFSSSKSLEYGTKKTILETTADVFAGYFLIPRYMVRKYEHLLQKRPMDMKDLIDIKKELNVSLMALTIGLHKYGYINDNIKKQIFNLLYRKGYGKSEPSPSLQLIKNQKLYRYVKSAYLNNNISMRDMSDLLGMNDKEINEAINQWEKEKVEKEEIESELINNIIEP